MSKGQKNNSEVVAKALKKYRDKAKAQGLKDLVILNVTPELKNTWDGFKDDMIIEKKIKNGAEALSVLLELAGYKY